MPPVTWWGDTVEMSSPSIIQPLLGISYGSDLSPMAQAVVQASKPHLLKVSCFFFIAVFQKTSCELGRITNFLVTHKVKNNPVLYSPRFIVFEELLDFEMYYKNSIIYDWPTGSKGKHSQWL